MASPISRVDVVGIPSSDAERSRGVLCGHARSATRRERPLRVLGRGHVLRDLAAGAVRRRVPAAGEQHRPASRGRRAGRARRARGEGCGVPRRDIRHRRLPHGELHRSGRQSADAAQALRAVQARRRRDRREDGLRFGAGHGSRALDGLLPRHARARADGRGRVAGVPARRERVPLPPGSDEHRPGVPRAAHGADRAARRRRRGRRAASSRSEGIAFFGETFDTGVCHMAHFADPDGNVLMLHRRYAPRTAP